MRLSNATLSTLPTDVVRPCYDRAAVQCGVVHLGIGAFHRAHQALIFERALASGDLRWGIIAASLRTAGMRDDLAPQDCLYSVAERDAAGTRLQVVGAVRRVLVAPEDPSALVNAIADNQVHLVTLTITEKGYYLDPATGKLLVDAADVAADLADLSQPRTAIGFIVAGLALRRTRGLSPLTVMSCDNLPHNGRLLRAATLTMARQHDNDLADWIATSSTFPNTMVDRIVPATASADIVALRGRIGVEDLATVKSEPFLQWVIEDAFSGARPAFENFGVTLTADVAPWEAAKLRLLNGAHSGIAYLGGLAGIETVDGFVADPIGRRFVELLWDEAATTISAPPGLDLLAYRTALMARFANPSLGHATRQIAKDGSQKILQRLLAPIGTRLAQGQSIEALGLAVAAWMHWQKGRDDYNAAFVVDDPLADETSGALKAAGIDAQVTALLALESIFPADLAANPRFAGVLQRWLKILSDQGARGALIELDTIWPAS